VEGCERTGARVDGHDEPHEADNIPQQDVREHRRDDALHEPQRIACAARRR